MPERSPEDEREDDGEVLLQYRDAVSNDEMRVVATPYEGDWQEVDDEWEVRYEKRTDGTEEWGTYATDFAHEKPEVTDV
ncbi:hypothetical protein [Halorubrum sp. LN27]|uniref:hypothetical protein n=1 Tax=Halorubrum sp. LN27 TaxID=2801032 RepID=UPI00190AF3B9|nr:hypothetical protein [Halorubrum sp. LN27]